MIKIIKKVVGPLDANCYTIIDDETKDCLIIDPGADFSSVFNFATVKNLSVKGVLLTHGHFDHAASGYLARENEIKVYISEGDAYMLSSRDNLASRFGLSYPFYTADETFGNGELQFGSIKVKTILTPGHTKGSACFIIDDKLFSGDTLFKDDFGNYNFPTGSLADLKNSLKNVLFKLDGDYVVYTGHGDKTTLNAERKNNYINEYQD